MVRGGCKRCGQQTPNNRLCKECQRLERQDFFVTEVEGYETPEEDDDQDDEDVLEYECTACETKYTTDGQDPCPDCGARRRRYIGPMGSGKTAATDGGVGQ